MRCHLDFETRSLADIFKTGAYRYAQDSSTDILCVAYAFDDGEVKLWAPDMPTPQDLWEASLNPRCEFHAFNVGFERRIWRFVMHRKYGWPEIEFLTKWYDTQADALAMGFPADLKRCAQALGLDAKKDTKGTRLINMLSKPISGTTKFREKKDHLELYLEMYEYCRQDVRVERQLANALTAETTREGKEREVFLLTESLNDRGIPIDVTLVNAFYSLIEVVMKDEAIERIEELTDGRISTGNQCQQMNKELDYPLPDFTAGTIRAALKCPLLSDRDRAIMEFRQIFSNTSTAKYSRMVDMHVDGVVRDTFQYHAAAPGRFGGRGIQPQNFPRSSRKDADEVARFVCHPDSEIEDIEEEYGPLQELAKSMLRSSLRAPHGKVFVCYDYSAIEACGVAWGTRDENQLEVFRSGKDIYIATAADMFDAAYDEVDGDQRQAGKISVLACGYQGGWKALRDFAAGYSVYWTPKESWNIVQNFRKARPNMVRAWEDFDRSAQEAMRDETKEVPVLSVVDCKFRMKGKHLRMTLPNGKYLWFPYAEIQWTEAPYVTPEGEQKYIERYSVTHMWINNGNQWVRRGIHGGSLFQSYIQAICRELMVEAMLRLDKAGWPLNGTVHDEIFGVVTEDQAKNHKEFRDIMTHVPDWAKGFPVKANGWVGRRYRK